jgi:copper chaperone
MSTTTTYRVSGMTCDHCVRAVTQELAALPCVAGVDVTLESGEVTVSSEREIEPDLVRVAVEEAGYELQT